MICDRCRGTGKAHQRSGCKAKCECQTRIDNITEELTLEKNYAEQKLHDLKAEVVKDIIKQIETNENYMYGSPVVSHLYDLIKLDLMEMQAKYQAMLKEIKKLTPRINH